MFWPVKFYFIYVTGRKLKPGVFFQLHCIRSVCEFYYINLKGNV